MKVQVLKRNLYKQILSMFRKSQPSGVKSFGVAENNPHKTSKTAKDKAPSGFSLPPKKPCESFLGELNIFR